jgi:16S rRNA (cytosine1402-N4)-methyltransferase
MIHEPVLLHPCIDALVINSSGTYVDVTYGAGGHSREILNRLDAKGRLISFDQDKETLGNTLDDPRFQLLHSNFRFIERFFDLFELKTVDGIFADLGMSSMQIDDEHRGFSFRFDGVLDMRMNDEGPSAADLLNEASEQQLIQILSDYGEVRNAITLAKALVEQRNQQSYHEVSQLTAVLERTWRGNQKRYYAQVFQALRIAVNDEMAALQALLETALDRLAPGGRLVVLTYHSLEDRMVKHFMKSGNVDGVQDKDEFGNIQRPFALITKKPILPGLKEIQVNPRARSAKLRIVEKK